MLYISNKLPYKQSSNNKAKPIKRAEWLFPYQLKILLIRSRNPLLKGLH